MSARLDAFLEAARDLGGCDLHLRTGQPPLVRVDGALVPLPYRTLDAVEQESLLRETVDDAAWERLERDGACVCAHDAGPSGRARMTLALHRDGLLAVLRLVPRVAPRLHELGLPRVVGDLARVRDGLVLVTGPTGSGRTTTIAGLVRATLEQGGHVVTIEDPIEFVHEDAHGRVVQRTRGVHVDSWTSGVREAMAAGADTIVLGDLVEADAIGAVLEATSAGVRVFATHPARGAVATLERLLDAFPSASQPAVRATLATRLRAIVSQQLVRAGDGRGRRAAHELLLVNDTVRSLVRDGRLRQLPGAMAAGKRSGMQLMDASLLALVRAGDVDPDAACLLAQEPRAFAPFVTRPELLALATSETRAA